MRMRRRLKPEPGSEHGGAGQRANDPITNLSAYALTLDVEYHRLDDRELELVKAESKAEEPRGPARA